ncbi:MAG TPA: nicotinate-nucleotide adenylyltransferase, partial [Microscillaceae bacterium]|nr:nicotinate-nucleotide adenylyltransferase [Microscillaceae bacterium]
MESRNQSAIEKARIINLQHPAYGSFAEIGAGQEVAAIFFKAGGASNTVAKTMSAYDMTFSNAIYGVEESGRYVCEPRLLKMIRREYDLVEERLGEKIGDDRPFFAFANTVTTINFTRTTQGHGWLGARFQLRPNTEPNEVVMHINMYDPNTLDQQAVVGIMGVNLMYACYYYSDNLEKFITSLMDGLSRERVEVDMLRLTGPDYAHIDNRLVSLELVDNGLTNAAIFGPDTNVMQPSDLLYKKHILALRGRFRPVTHVNMDMLRCGYEHFAEEKDVDKSKILTLAELTLADLSLKSGEIDKKDFLDRVDILCSLGMHVMISNYQEYYRLVNYFSQYTKQKIGIVLGVYNLETIFQEKYYENLKGGILESFSTLFSRNVKLYVYPSLRRESQEHLYTCINFQLPRNLTDLYEYLIVNDKIEDIINFDKSHLHIISDNVLAMIKDGKGGWE